MNVQNTFHIVSTQPSASDLAQLFQMQENLDYEAFTHEERPDGNFVCVVDESVLPAWVKATYPKLCDEAKFFVFLKNKGGVVRHRDVPRSCSVTFPVVTITQPTHFYETRDEAEAPYAKLTHGTTAYLQNNSRLHDVPKCDEERIFFQISFDKTFEEMLEFI